MTYMIETPFKRITKLVLDTGEEIEVSTRVWSFSLAGSEISVTFLLQPWQAKALLKDKEDNYFDAYTAGSPKPSG